MGLVYFIDAEGLSSGAGLKDKKGGGNKSRQLNSGGLDRTKRESKGKF